MARLIAIVLILGMYRPDALLAGGVFEVGEIDSNSVQPGAFVEVIYGEGERHPDTGAWEKWNTARGYLKAVDADRIAIGGRFWKKEIEYERVQKLTVLDDAHDAKKSTIEIGANLMSITFLAGENRWTIISLGGGDGFWTIAGPPSFYISGFIFDQMAFDLALGLTSVYRGDVERSWTLWTGQGGVAYFLREGNAPYIKSVAAIAGSEGESTFGAGIGMGYRHVVQNRMALRFETQYVRWFESKENQINIRLSFGVVLGGNS